MKKNLIALAVAGALIAPAAMAEVTVSGGLQAELVRIQGNGPQPNGLYAADGFQMGSENGGNYGFLKFAANEDLGGGMKAIAVYNLNANVGDTDRGGLSQRDAYVGLSTGLGTILAGSLATPYKSSTASWDPMLATSFQARGSYGMSGLHNGYVSNAVAYANGFMGGMIKVVAAVVVDETRKNEYDWAAAPGTIVASDKTTGQNAKSFSVTMAPMSGLEIAVAHIDLTNFGNKNVDVPEPFGGKQKDVNATKIGAKFSSGPVTVAAQVEMLNKGMTVVDKRANVAYVTGTFNIDDANGVSVSVGRSAKDAIAYNGTAGNIYVAGKDGNYVAASFNHAFSKNTNAYAGLRVSDAGVMTEVDALTGIPTGNTANTKETALGVGLRVNF